MKAILLLCLAVAVAHCRMTQEMVDQINSMPGITWRASMDTPVAQMSDAAYALYMQNNVPVYDNQGRTKLPKGEAPNVAVPDSFDSRTNWPKCTTMQAIRDQSDCGSCWAFGAVEAMSDRECVFSYNKSAPSIVSISAEDMNSCNTLCGSCNGGQPACAWSHWVSKGLRSEACYPYSLPGCDHHIPDSSNPCPTNGYPTPACKATGCSVQGQTPTIYKGSSSYELHGEAAIKQELFTNGPCETAFTVYEDFESYTGGIYQHTSGRSVGGHAVKFVGWGVGTSGTEAGVPYWLVANSWNVHWGEQGYFRIIRGKDECGIENTIYCGKPVSA